MYNSGSVLYVLVEDNSLAQFLDRTLTLTMLRSMPLKVIPCGGWNGVFTQYERLIQNECAANQIVPILDSDTIERRVPRKSTLLDNLNLFRLSYDLEYAFENWMIAEALLQLQSSPFGEELTPRNYLALEHLIQRARSLSVQGSGPLYQCLEQCCREEYAHQGNDRSMFVSPSKVELASAVAEIVYSTGDFPSELALLVQHLERTAKSLGLVSDSANVTPSSMVLHYETVAALKLTGKILVSIVGHRPSLWLINLDKPEINPIKNNREISYASWSVNSNLIAGGARIHDSPEHKRGSILIFEESGIEKGWVSTHTSIGTESRPCWWPDGYSLLLYTHQGTTFRVTRDSKRWKQLYSDATASHCVSSTGRIARTRYDGNHYFLEVGSRDGNEPYQIIPNTTDVRGTVSWSHSGRYLAFANHTDINNRIGDVCIYDFHTQKTKYLTSHNGFPYFVCFSPDERFILFTWSKRNGHSSLRVVEIESSKVSNLLDGVPSELVIGCHGWCSTQDML